MNRDQFDHLLRAAAAVLNEDCFVVIGSQAMLGSVEPIAAAQLSVELDLVPIDDPTNAKADLLNGTLGKLSMFHDSFKVYVQGTSSDVATLPDGWRDRLVPYRSAAAPGVTALCLELHDLWVSKAVAGREKDVSYCAAALNADLVDRNILSRRLSSLPRDVPAAKMELAHAMISGRRPIPLSNARGR